MLFKQGLHPKPNSGLLQFTHSWNEAMVTCKVLCREAYVENAPTQSMISPRIPPPQNEAGYTSLLSGTIFISVLSLSAVTQCCQRISVLSLRLLIHNFSCGVSRISMSIFQCQLDDFSNNLFSLSPQPLNPEQTPTFLPSLWCQWSPLKTVTVTKNYFWALQWIVSGCTSSILQSFILLFAFPPLYRYVTLLPMHRASDKILDSGQLNLML